MHAAIAVFESTVVERLEHVRFRDLCTRYKVGEKATCLVRRVGKRTLSRGSTGLRPKGKACARMSAKMGPWPCENPVRNPR